MHPSVKRNIISRLQEQILCLEGFKHKPAGEQSKLGITDIEKNFPNGVFPTGVIHEFLSEKPENTACTSAFISALLFKLHQNKGFYIWIGKQKQISPVGLKNFGILPHQIIFINLIKQKDILWATEEALKCKSIKAVISELDDITFAQSQRLQLTVEKSKVTGLILRTQTQQLNATACAARWKITASNSNTADNLPGVGFAKWKVELLKVRNGSTASCQIIWQNQQFNTVKLPITPLLTQKIVG